MGPVNCALFLPIAALVAAAPPQAPLGELRTATIAANGRGGGAVRNLLLEAAREGQRRGFPYFRFVDPSGTAADAPPRTRGRHRLRVRFLDEQEASGYPEAWRVADILAAAAAAE